MAKKKVVTEATEVTVLSPDTTEVASETIYDAVGYIMLNKNNRWEIHEVPVYSETLELGTPRLVEYNTDKYIIKDRLHILLLTGDFL